VQLHAVAHGNHGLGALVIVKNVMHSRAGALEDGVRMGRFDLTGPVACAIQREFDRQLRVWNRKLRCRDRLEFRRKKPLRLRHQLAVFDVETDRRVGVIGVGVLAAHGFKRTRIGSGLGRRRNQFWSSTGESPKRRPAHVGG
jgi:hypothetical protein